MEISSKISVCLIAKNEELFIRHCLESVLPIADEIIVLDTGSTDKTKEICKSFMNSPPSGQVQDLPEQNRGLVKLYETTWKNDFALAKNECMSYASGDWILFIDANEMLTIETQKTLLPLLCEQLNKNEPVIFWFKVNNLEPGNPEPTDYNLKQYLFKTGFGIHYFGELHESLISNETSIKTIKCPFLAVNHFASPQKMEKVKYYASLSKKIIEDPDYDITVKRNHYFHLALCYIRMGEYEKALEIQYQAYNFFKNESAFQKSHLFITLINELASNLILNFGRSEEAIKYLEEALQIQKDFPDNLFFLGLGYLQLGNYNKFIEVFNELLNILISGKFEETFGEFSTRGKALMPRVYLELGRVLIINGESSLGLEYILKANELYPGKREILIPLIAHYAINDNLDKAIYYYLKYRTDLTCEDKINFEAAAGLPAGRREYKKIQSDLLLGLVKLDIWLPEERKNIFDKITSLKS